MKKQKAKRKSLRSRTGRINSLSAQLREAKSSDEVLRVAFLIHCELKDLVDSK